MGDRWCPSGKKGYRDETDAKRAITIIRQVGERRATSPCRAYRCPRCGRWHLTHETSSDRGEMQRPLRSASGMRAGKPLKRSTPLKARRRGLAPRSQARIDEDPEYEAAKATVALRDRGVCQAEGMDGIPHGGRKDPHHVCPLGRQGPRCEPENMTTLCRVSHDWAHAHPREALELGLLLHAGATIEDMRYAALLRAQARGENLEGEAV